MVSYCYDHNKVYCNLARLSIENDNWDKYMYKCQFESIEWVDDGIIIEMDDAQTQNIRNYKYVKATLDTYPCNCKSKTNNNSAGHQLAGVYIPTNTFVIMCRYFTFSKKYDLNVHPFRNKPNLGYFYHQTFVNFGQMDVIFKNLRMEIAVKRIQKQVRKWLERPYYSNGHVGLYCRINWLECKNIINNQIE